MHIIRNAGTDGLSLDTEALATGRNSGFQAINLAVLAGAATIILLGYDGKKAGDATHFFGHHPKREPESVYAMYCASFRSGAAAMRAAGARVINCSTDSAVDAFEKMPLADALCIGA